MDDMLTALLPESWVCTRLAIERSEIERLRATGELFAEQRAGSGEWCYPAWQFGPGGTVPAGVRDVVRAARRARITQGNLMTLLRRRVGLMGGGRLLDLVFEGRSDYVVAAIESAAHRVPSLTTS